MVSRDHVTVRLSPVGLDKVAAIMAETGANRSEVIRRLLADALASDAIVKSVKAKLVDRG